MLTTTAKKSGTLILILIILLIGFGLYYLNTVKNEQNSLVLHGNVDIRQVELGFRVPGRLIEMNFEEGDRVKKGDLLAKLDKVPFENDLKLKMAQVDQAAANLVKLRKGNRPQEIQEARAGMREKQIAYENAKKTADRQAELVHKNFASKQNYDDAIARATEAEAQLKTAKEALTLVEEGFRIEDVLVGNAQVEAAKSTLAIAATSLDDTNLIAPNDGIIFTRIKEPGAIVPVGSSVYTLSLVNPVWVRAYISEVNLGNIAPGMKAKVYFDAAPDHPLEGQIGYISPQAEFTPKNVETKELRTDLVYRLRITVNDPKQRLRQGMPVTVHILREKQ